MLKQLRQEAKNPLRNYRGDLVNHVIGGALLGIAKLFGQKSPLRLLVAMPVVTWVHDRTQHYAIAGGTE